MSNGEFWFRAAAQNRRVLAAVREIDHPGVLADCVNCLGDTQPALSERRGFLASISGKAAGCGGAVTLLGGWVRRISQPRLAG